MTNYKIFDSLFALDIQLFLILWRI